MPQPVEHRRDARRLVGRRRRRGRGGRAAARARLRRRRLDSHPGLVLRSLRDEALARPRLARAVRERLARARRQNGPISVTVRDAAAFLDVIVGLRAGRRALGTAAGATVPRRGRRRPRPAADRVHGRAADPVRGRPALRRRRARRGRRARALGHDVVERTPAVAGRGASVGVREHLADRAGALPRRRRVRC